MEVSQRGMSAGTLPAYRAKENAYSIDGPARARVRLSLPALPAPAGASRPRRRRHPGRQ